MDNGPYENGTLQWSVPEPGIRYISLRLWTRVMGFSRRSDEKPSERLCWGRRGSWMYRLWLVLMVRGIGYDAEEMAEMEELYL